MTKAFRITAIPLTLVLVLLLSERYAVSREQQTSLSVQIDSTVNWKEMTRSERKERMRDVIMPKMEHAFAEFDSQKFGHIKCATCHGDGARSGEYDMPNPKLPKLPKNAEGFKKLEKDQPEMMKFMSDVVKPDMAKLLGMKQYDPKTKTGFSCGNCHTTAK